MSTALAGVRATRPDVPDICAQCQRVVRAVMDAVDDYPDATEFHAHCAPETSSVDAAVTIVVVHGGEGGNETLPARTLFCPVARAGIMGSDG